jgi:hypothetical protein
MRPSRRPLSSPKIAELGQLRNIELLAFVIMPIVVMSFAGLMAWLGRWYTP